MKQQITVKTKGQLIAAFHCAKAEYINIMAFEKKYQNNLKTKIILKRKTGETVFDIHCSKPYFAKYIDKAIRNIRKLKAKELLA